MFWLSLEKYQCTKKFYTRINLLQAKHQLVRYPIYRVKSQDKENSWLKKKFKMADFDAIYEDLEDTVLDAPNISLIPEPVIVRGAGNITV